MSQRSNFIISPNVIKLKMNFICKTEFLSLSCTATNMNVTFDQL